MDNTTHQPNSRQAPNVEIISPHYDDAVYSCWHMIDNDARVVTLFGGYPEDEAPSAWDESTGFDNSRLAIETRKSENEAALRATGALAVGLAFKDTVFRQDGELTAQEIFETLKTLLETNAQVVAPIGFSFSFQHPDHILTREAAKMLMQDGRDVIFYADIPYSLQPDRLERWPGALPVENIKRLLGTDVAILTYEMSDEERLAKKVAVEAYSSQFARNNALSGNVFDNPLTYGWECLIQPL